MLRAPGIGLKELDSCDGSSERESPKASTVMSQTHLAEIGLVPTDKRGVGQS